MQLSLVGPFELFAKSEAFIHVLNELELVLVPLYHFSNGDRSTVFVSDGLPEYFPVGAALVVEFEEGITEHGV